MGCFLGCFGYSKKRRPRKPANRILLGDQLQRLGSYEPLDSSVSIKLDLTENPISSDSESRDKPKQRSSFKIRKKVSFNLNVQTYEPIPTQDFLESDEEKNGEKHEEEEAAKAGVSLSISEEDSLALRMGSYPSDYRYQNCLDSYDAEDEIVFDEDDLYDDEYEDEDEDEDEEEDDDDDGDSHHDDRKINQGEFSEQLYALSMESQKRASLTQLAEDKTNKLMPLPASPNQKLEMLGTNRIARDRSQYVHPVLNPVENLTQWKAVKARAIPPLKHQMKENVLLEQEPRIPSSSKPSFNPSSFNITPNLCQSKPLLQDIAVDASLSNWLNSSEITLVTKSSTIPIAAISSKKTWGTDRNSQINTEQRLI